MSQNIEKEQSLLASLKSMVGDAVTDLYVNPKRIKALADSARIVEVAKAVRELGFDQVMSVGGTDFPKEDVFALDYQLISVGNNDLKK
ncbi:MAG: hypothetical protein HYU02_02525, partial [Thaumarchaeota archaeon]|nr:hypothetical protein [Nitrososphaerota archaeon]